MILPKHIFERIDHFEHTVEIKPGSYAAYDKFTLHFKSWWRPKRVIWIRRSMKGQNENGDTLYNVTPSAADLYSQLNNWAIQTWDEKLDSVKKKYKSPKDGSNVIQLKQKPKDIND